MTEKDHSVTNFRGSRSDAGKDGEEGKRTAGNDGKCVTCMFWEVHKGGKPEEEKTGVCCVFPPSPTPVMQQSALGQAVMALQMFRPVTRETDWCGEHSVEGTFNG